MFHYLRLYVLKKLNLQFDFVAKENKLDFSYFFSYASMLFQVLKNPRDQTRRNNGIAECILQMKLKPFLDVLTNNFS